MIDISKITFDEFIAEYQKNAERITDCNLIHLMKSLFYGVQSGEISKCDLQHYIDTLEKHLEHSERR